MSRVGTLCRSHPDHAVMANGRLQEVFVMKDENYEEPEQYSITNRYLLPEVATSNEAKMGLVMTNKYCVPWECMVICYQE